MKRALTNLSLISILIFSLGMKENSKYFKNFPLSEKEKIVMNKVSKEYNLTTEQKKLLYVIRKIENGRKGIEFGVMNRRARRYKDGIKSFLIQCRWTAGSIKKHYQNTKDLNKFANRWAPVEANWINNAKYYLNYSK